MLNDYKNVGGDVFHCSPIAYSVGCHYSQSWRWGELMWSSIHMKTLNRYCWIFLGPLWHVISPSSSSSSFFSLLFFPFSPIVIVGYCNMYLEKRSIYIEWGCLKGEGTQLESGNFHWAIGRASSAICREPRCCQPLKNDGS